MSEVSSSHISPLGRLAAITVARRWGWRWQGWGRVGARARCERGTSLLNSQQCPVKGWDATSGSCSIRSPEGQVRAGSAPSVCAPPLPALAPLPQKGALLQQVPVMATLSLSGYSAGSRLAPSSMAKQSPAAAAFALVGSCAAEQEGPQRVLE